MIETRQFLSGVNHLLEDYKRQDGFFNDVSLTTQKPVVGATGYGAVDGIKELRIHDRGILEIELTNGLSLEQLIQLLQFNQETFSSSDKEVWETCGIHYAKREQNPLKVRSPANLAYVVAVDKPSSGMRQTPAGIIFLFDYDPHQDLVSNLRITRGEQGLLMEDPSLKHLSLIHTQLLDGITAVRSENGRYRVFVINLSNLADSYDDRIHQIFRQYHAVGKSYNPQGRAPHDERLRSIIAELSLPIVDMIRRHQ